MNLVDSLYDRAISAFPVSVGTSLALESIASGEYPPIDPNRKIPNQVIISNYDEMWINLHTLFRNFIGSMDRTYVPRLAADEVLNVLLEEMEIISEVISTASFSNTKMVYYACTYESLNSPILYKFSRLRVDTTDMQKFLTKLFTDTIKALIKTQKESKDLEKFDIRFLDSELKKPIKDTIIIKNKGLIITHKAFDLLSHVNFSVLDLLESHTGVLKPREMWYTKFYQGKELSRIPFCNGMLQVFGDSETFSPMDIKLRKDIIDLAEKYKWTQVTTREKIRDNIAYLKNPFFKEVLKTII